MRIPHSRYHGATCAAKFKGVCLHVLEAPTELRYNRGSLLFDNSSENENISCKFWILSKIQKKDEKKTVNIRSLAWTSSMHRIHSLHIILHCKLSSSIQLICYRFCWSKRVSYLIWSYCCALFNGQILNGVHGTNWQHLTHRCRANVYASCVCVCVFVLILMCTYEHKSVWCGFLWECNWTSIQWCIIRTNKCKLTCEIWFLNG